MKPPTISRLRVFPNGHWKKIWSTNPLEQLNKQIKRRTDVVGVFPNPKRSCGWPVPCSSRSATNGRPANAFTCPTGSHALYERVLCGIGTCWTDRGGWWFGNELRHFGQPLSGMRFGWLLNSAGLFARSSDA